MNHLRLIDIDLSHPLNVLSVMNCNVLNTITCHNFLIIDTTASKVQHLRYKVDRTTISDKPQKILEEHFLKIE